MQIQNIATVFKNEITRLARKELRVGTTALKKASAQYRSDIAELKRQVTGLEREIASFRKNTRTRALEPVGDASPAQRFGAKGFAAQRRRLGLSAGQMGVLLNCSGQSVYKWEQGSARPRAKQMPAILALRKLSKSQAAAVLGNLF